MLGALFGLEEQGNAPKSRYRNQKVYDFSEERSTAARNPRNSVKREECNRTPVQSADYYEAKSYFVYDAHKKSPLQEKNLDVVRLYFARACDFYSFFIRSSEYRRRSCREASGALAFQFLKRRSAIFRDALQRLFAFAAYSLEAHSAKR